MGLTIKNFKEHILLLNGDDFTSAPLKVLRDVENFIGVPQFFMEDHFDFSGPFISIMFSIIYFWFDLISIGRKGYPCFTLDKNGCAAKSKAREHPELQEETLTLLRNHFAPMLKRFEMQTGMKLELS